MLCFDFAQIYKIYNYGQYRVHDKVINVLTNMDQTQAILSWITYDQVTIKYSLNDAWIWITLYVMKCLSKHGNVCFQDLIKMPLYKNLNVTIHHQWESLFNLHINSNFQTHICDNLSSNNFYFDSEKMRCTSTYTSMHYFLDIFQNNGLW
jgi:hypothetical protein